MRPLLALLLPLALALALPARAAAQAIGTPRTGPMIEGFGPVYDVPAPDLPASPDKVYRVVFEVAAAAEKPDQLNRNLETVARFLNMHARAGVPPENLRLALVVHGPAGKDLLSNAAYRTRFGVDNPNAPLLESLGKAGVRIYLCGQTAMSRGLPKEELAPPVKMALSAMTALVALQDEGYRLIAF